MPISIIPERDNRGQSKAITNLYALNKFLVPAEAICSDYESFMDSKANWEDRLFAAKRKYRDLCSNVSQLGNRAAGVSRSAYGAGKLVFEIIEELSACELELEKLGAKIAVASL